MAKISDFLQLEPEEVKVPTQQIVESIDRFRSLQWIYGKTPAFKMALNDRIISVDGANILEFIQDYLGEWTIGKS